MVCSRLIAGKLTNSATLNLILSHGYIPVNHFVMILTRRTVQDHLAPFDLHHTLFAHLFQFTHHGAAVGGNIVCQRTERKRQHTPVGVALGCQHAEIAHQLLANAAAAEDLHPLRQRGGLFRHQTEHVFHHATVMITGLFAALGQLITAHKPNLTGLFAHHSNMVAADIVKHQHLTKHAAGVQVLQNGTAAVFVNTLQQGAALGQNTDGTALGIKFIHHILGVEILLTHAKAIAHAVPLVPADSFKNG